LLGGILAYFLRRLVVFSARDRLERFAGFLPDLPRSKFGLANSVAFFAPIS
jgi:hypothetical protein